MRADIEKLRRELGNPEPPKEITQKPFDDDPAHLKRLVHLKWGEIPSVYDLGCYVEDISWCTVVQPDFFRFMTPVLLEMWNKDILGIGDPDYEGVIAWFYLAPVRRALFRELLGEPEERAVKTYMRDTILDRIDMEHELAVPGTGPPPYEWIGSVSNFAIMFSDIADLWLPWWVQETQGQAIGVLQFCSALIYNEDDNPIFAPWTRTAGHGPPTVWGAVGHVYEQQWRPENVSFVKATLTADYVESSVRRAAERLSTLCDSPIPAQMVEELPHRREILARRLSILPKILAARQDRFLSWSDAGA